MEVAATESDVSEFDTLSSTGYFNILTLDHMKEKTNSAILGHIGHFDNEFIIVHLPLRTPVFLTLHFTRYLGSL